MRALLCCLALVATLGATPAPRTTTAAKASGTAPIHSVPITLSAAQRAVLDRYLKAVIAGKYDEAYTLLSGDEQHYFGTAANYASVFAADRIRVSATKLLRAESAGQLGALALVLEHLQFFDHAHQHETPATARVAYGLLNESGGIRIKDPYHPWRAFDPAGATATAGGLQIIVRKISFFTGRVEFLLTFINAGDGTVTLLPYGRSVLRDDKGSPYRLIETKLQSLTDRNLRLGLRLAGGAQYTGALTFFTPDRFSPASLSLTVAPQLRDGADAPFEVQLPAIPVPG